MRVCEDIFRLKSWFEGFAASGLGVYDPST